MLNFSAINVGDYKFVQIDKSVDTHGGKEPGTVKSDIPYKVKHEKRGPNVPDQNNSKFIPKTVIEFPIPIVNYLFTYNGAGVLKKLIASDANLGIKESEVLSLCNGTAVLDVDFSMDTHKIYYINELTESIVYDCERHAIGGHAIRYLLDNLNINTAIISYLTAHFSKVTSKEGVYIIDAENNESTLNDNPSIFIIDRYYIVDTRNGSTINKELKYIENNRKSLVIKDGDNKGSTLPLITILINYREQTDGGRHNEYSDIYNLCCMSNQVVYPLGYRDNSKFEDPFTLNYNDLFNKSLELNNICLTPGTPLISICNSYRNLVNSYNAVIFRTPKKYLNYRKSHVEALTGKTGIIRFSVQGCTLDYSARCVITVDKDMPIDSIGIPITIARNLVEIYVLDSIDGLFNNKASYVKNKTISDTRVKDFIEQRYIIIGRQPTLYNLSIQGFKVKIVDGYSIVLPPLATPAFNADFDGDQMYVYLPQTEEGQNEARNIMANVKNIHRPRDGYCHIVPRQEVLYGLAICFEAKPNGKGKAVYKDVSHFRNIIMHDIEYQEHDIEDSCIVGNRSFDTVGEAALRLCIGNAEVSSVRLGHLPLEFNTNRKDPSDKLSEEFFSALFSYISKKDNGIDKFVSACKRLTNLGFTVAKLYPPALDIFGNYDNHELCEEFHSEIEKQEEMFNLGFDTDESYNAFYEDKASELSKKISQNLLNNIDADNGFLKLVQTKARGSMSNINQMFGIKGSIIKNSTEVFPTIIEKSLIQQLSSIDHFITAYGTREGLIDKSIKTFDPGYFNRIMNNAAHNIIITNDDCGTTNGIRVTFDLLHEYCHGNYEDDLTDFQIIKNFARRILCSSYIVGNNQVVSDNNFDAIFNTKIASIENGTVIKYDGVLLRTTITCDNPCCAKCYGIDLGANAKVVKGTAIGSIAAQAIGEPITQLTMKTFQKGGISGSKGLMSSYDIVKHMLELHKDRNMDDIYDVSSILRYEGVDAAVVKLVFALYSLFEKQIFVHFKHFATVVSSMIHYICMKPGNSFETGRFYTDIEFKRHNGNPDNFIKVLRGVHKVVEVRNDFLSALFLENFTVCLRRNIVLSSYDTLEDPLVRATLGLKPNIGLEFNPDFIRERGV